MYFFQVQHLSQLLQTPYQCVRGVESSGPVVERGAMTSAPDDGGREGVGVEMAGSERGGGRVGEGESAGAVLDDISRYYTKPPDWALTLCVT